MAAACRASMTGSYWGSMPSIAKVASDSTSCTGCLVRNTASNVLRIGHNAQCGVFPQSSGSLTA